MSIYNTHINFMRPRKIAAGLSIFCVLLSVVLLFVKPLNLGLEFTGGTLVEVNYQAAPDLESLRQWLDQQGYHGAKVQHFGSAADILIRVPPQRHAVVDDKKLGQHLFDQLKMRDQSITLKRVEFVGPQVGDDLKDQSGGAFILALVCILIYVSFRFKFKFALGTILSLLHDAAIVVGVFSLFQITFDLNVLAAVLAVTGYSVNDSVVIADRIRENFTKAQSGDPMTIMNDALNQTLSRTLITVLTVFLVLIALLVLGGEELFGFSLALIIGLVVGTYSSIYVLAAFLMMMKVSREDFLELPVSEIDDRP